MHPLLAVLTSSSSTPRASACPEALARGRVVIHVGPPKTGSSHTQAWLFGHARALQQEGWGSPRDRPTGEAYLRPKSTAALLPFALCGDVMGTRTGPLGQYQTRARDDAAAERILSAWRARLKRAASEAPNLVLSNELFFHMACDGGWQRFRQLLAEAGYAAATVVMMLRTPLV